MKKLVALAAVVFSFGFIGCSEQSSEQSAEDATAEEAGEVNDTGEDSPDYPTEEGTE